MGAGSWGGNGALRHAGKTNCREAVGTFYLFFEHISQDLHERKPNTCGTDTLPVLVWGHNSEQVKVKNSHLVQRHSEDSRRFLHGHQTPGREREKTKSSSVNIVGLIYSLGIKSYRKIELALIASVMFPFTTSVLKSPSSWERHNERLNMRDTNLHQVFIGVT